MQVYLWCCLCIGNGTGPNVLVNTSNVGFWVEITVRLRLRNWVNWSTLVVMLTRSSVFDIVYRAPHNAWKNVRLRERERERNIWVRLYKTVYSSSICTKTTCSHTFTTMAHDKLHRIMVELVDVNSWQHAWFYYCYNWFSFKSKNWYVCNLHMHRSKTCAKNIC